MKKLLKRPPFIILAMLIILTVGSIFIHSMMTPAASSAESETVGGIVEDVVDTVAPDNVTLKEYLKQNIRKIAHFIEFGALGAEAILLSYLCLTHFSKGKERIKAALYVKASAYALAFGFIIAFLDESLQLISKRGPLIEDVWLDLGGFVSFSILTVGVIALVKLIIYFVKNAKTP